MSRDRNAIKAAKLGIPFGSACNTLRKTLLFKYVCSAGDNVCHRCNKLIEDLKDFSIEHKVSWFLSDKPYELFFDINNISFSHIKCNSGSGARPHKKTLEQRREARAKIWDRNKDKYNSQRRAKRQ